MVSEVLEVGGKRSKLTIKVDTRRQRIRLDGSASVSLDEAQRVVEFIEGSVNVLRQLSKVKPKVATKPKARKATQAVRRVVPAHVDEQAEETSG